ncbi:MAG: hypothetical protein GXO50_02560 [Chlorobi bacterium]|nr:hypothetical protein [Chlorobiota bacterium]
MKTKQFKLLSFIFVLGLFVFSACDDVSEPDSQSAEDDARGSYIMADAFAVSDAEAGSGGKSLVIDGMTVERDIQNPMSFTLVFDNCDYRGSVRNGKIHVTYSVPDPDTPRAVNVNITFEDYTMDGVKVEGSMASVFGGTIDIPEINIVATGMKATFPDGKFISWSSAQKFRIVEGYDDGNPLTNVMEVSGTTEGINRAGESYVAVYSSVVTKGDCQYPVSGTVAVTSDKGETIIDYGDGECDDIISVTSSGVTVTIHLD